MEGEEQETEGVILQLDDKVDTNELEIEGTVTLRPGGFIANLGKIGWTEEDNVLVTPGKEGTVTDGKAVPGMAALPPGRGVEDPKGMRDGREGIDKVDDMLEDIDVEVLMEEKRLL